jgi:hypothetical protein
MPTITMTLSHSPTRVALPAGTPLLTNTRLPRNRCSISAVFIVSAPVWKIKQYSVYCFSAIPVIFLGHRCCYSVRQLENACRDTDCDWSDVAADRAFGIERRRDSFCYGFRLFFLLERFTRQLRSSFGCIISSAPSISQQLLVRSSGKHTRCLTGARNER